jgi:hypothetical protein
MEMPSRCMGHFFQAKCGNSSRAPTTVTPSSIRRSSTPSRSPTRRLIIAFCAGGKCIVLFEKGEDDLSALRRGRKRKGSVGLHQTEMPLVPLILLVPV